VPVRVLAVLAALVLGLLAPAAAPASLDPVLPGDTPDPSIARAGDGFLATATSDRWAPVFPLLHSRDLLRWRRVGAVFARPPAWVRGGRFWAPEIAWLRGRLVVLYAALRRSGGFCIAAASARRARGPWRDEGPLLCPPGGAIDPAAIDDGRGQGHLVFKRKGVGRGIYAAPLDLDALRVTGPAVRLLEPGPGEGGVSEGPALLRRGRWWYLFYSAGHCCTPPCSYVQTVARSRRLLGPYAKARRPLLRGSARWRCPGHGTPIELAHGRTVLLHHALAAADRALGAERRRRGVLTELRVDRRGWPVAPRDAGGLGRRLAVAALLRALAGPRDARAADEAPWGWLIGPRPLGFSARGAAVELACRGDAALSRALDDLPVRVTATVVLPENGLGTAPGVFARGWWGELRGLEVHAGRVRAVRRQGPRVVAAGPPVPVPAGTAVRVRLAIGARGELRAALRAPGGWRAVPAGPVARGPVPTRLALGCRGTGRARFARIAEELDPRAWALRALGAAQRR